MVNISAYLILIVAVVLGTAANGFAKGAQGFTLLIPSIVTAISIVGCMYALSLVMKSIPVGVTYASFAGLCIIATSLVGLIKFNQVPNMYVIIGLGLIVAGVLMVNLLGKTNT
tara:strand:- start:263 stop:601 length:339 start_codon:yes stop_codon:yes gene_type:complete